jgi:RNA polymerase sigma factor (sigma-70 family)
MQRLSDLLQYVTDIASIPRISHEEACHLKSHLAAARQGSFSPNLVTQAEHRLIEGHLWLVVSPVRRSPARLCTLSPLDLVQEGALGLLRAVEHFDIAAPGNFTAYASTTIRYAILDALQLEDTIKVSYDLSWRKHTDERVEALCALVLPDSADEDERHQAKRAHTLTAIARHLGLDCSTVCNIERHALQKLRSSQHPETEEDHPPQMQRQHEQSQRLAAACAALEVQETPISVRSLARLTHLDKEVVQPFLRSQRAADAAAVPQR